MKKVKFWGTIYGSISEEDGRLLWSKIQYGKEINLTLLLDRTYIYGETTEDVLANVISQCINLGHILTISY